MSADQAHIWLFRRCVPWLLAGASLGFTGCASMMHGPLRPAQNVDLQAWTGDWFVTAALPGSFYKGIQRPIERYMIYPDGEIHTTFLAWDGSRLIKIPGTARVKDPKSPAVWTVTSDPGLFKPQLVILQVADDYRYAVVTTSDRRHAWVLSRTRQLPPADYGAALEILRSNGIRTTRLIPLAQP